MIDIKLPYLLLHILKATKKRGCFSLIINAS